jgi:hypothetical protein
MKTCQETPNLVKIGQKYRPLHMIELSILKSLTAARNNLQLDNSAKESHYCVSMATMVG